MLGALSCFEYCWIYEPNSSV